MGQRERLTPERDARRSDARARGRATDESSAGDATEDSRATRRANERRERETHARRGEARGLEREGARAIEGRDDDDGRRRGPGADAGDAGDERGRDGDDAERTRGAAAGSSTRGVEKVCGIVVTAQGASREIASRDEASEARA